MRALEEIFSLVKTHPMSACCQEFFRLLTAAVLIVTAPRSVSPDSVVCKRLNPIETQAGKDVRKPAGFAGRVLKRFNAIAYDCAMQF
ncbi:hypothetical protein ASE07_11380 [Noviherbaspirillum sp. Root189]|nr:hypothetical protein ASE07_11380 [Noviherbaspirillum sp. Root189]